MKTTSNRAKIIYKKFCGVCNYEEILRYLRNEKKNNVNKDKLYKKNQHWQSTTTNQQFTITDGTQVVMLQRWYMSTNYDYIFQQTTIMTYFYKLRGCISTTLYFYTRPTSSNCENISGIDAVIGIYQENVTKRAEATHCYGKLSEVLLKKKNMHIYFQESI